MHTVGLACLVATANLSAATRVFAEARHPTSSVNLEKASSLCEMQPLRHQKIHQPSQEGERLGPRKIRNKNQLAGGSAVVTGESLSRQLSRFSDAPPVALICHWRMAAILARLVPDNTRTNRRDGISSSIAWEDHGETGR
ncbi:hypothetical protein AnigIFM63604_008326 [Aspergillus niger]|uniref:Secreted protein n=1 Tax=Aspergillus niger TaxID=5061 RepID=A0A9W6EB72_ASPNG|nr:hypothetical protein AnigIFM63604_008326 [Aspergillus niger]